MSESTEPAGAAAPPPPRDPPPREPPRQETYTPSAGSDQRISDLRAEAAAHRVEARNARERAEQLETQLAAATANVAAAREDAVRPLQARLQALQTTTIEATLAAAATAAGLVDADLLGLRARMPDAPKVEIDESGKVTGVTEFVEKFRAWKPDYFRAAAAAGAGGGQQGTAQPPPPAPGAGGRQTGAAAPAAGSPPRPTNVKDMTPDQYAAFKNQQLKDLRRVM